MVDVVQMVALLCQSSQAKPSQVKSSQARPSHTKQANAEQADVGTRQSQAKPSQTKSSQAKLRKRMRDKPMGQTKAKPSQAGLRRSESSQVKLSQESFDHSGIELGSRGMRDHEIPRFPDARAIM